MLPSCHTKGGTHPELLEQNLNGVHVGGLRLHLVQTSLSVVQPVDDILAVSLILLGGSLQVLHLLVPGKEEMSR